MGCSSSSSAEAAAPPEVVPKAAAPAPEPAPPVHPVHVEEVSDALKVGDINPELSVDLETADEETNDPYALLCKFGCGKRVQPGTTRSGKPFDTCCRLCALNQGIGIHDHTCEGKKGDSVPSRMACKDGAKCRNRSAAHLAEVAHPLDLDYATAAARTPGMAPEPLTLRILFDWTDADGSGKLSRKELETALVQISKVFPSILPKMTEDAWNKLDEDGNGVVNFGEFASWAGPRLGLPLGMRKTIQKTASQVMGTPCSVMNCPCEQFEPGGFSLYGGSVCKACKHKEECHVSRASTAAEVPTPPYWDNQSGKFNQRINMIGASKEDFQALFNATYRSVPTRDRKVHNPTCPKVPRRFEVVSVMRNENSESWTEFGSRRGDIMEKYSKERLDPPVEHFETKTSAALNSIASMSSRLEKSVNEWYLFHGTNPAAAKAICEKDFTVRRAGSNTGTLYGRGLYFAESITKADEYAKPDENGLYAALLCRVLGGRVRYTADPEPDPEELVNSCIEGPYDCVCGDREVCRGTYREFVLFDSEDVYVEYIVLYRRVYG
mmetsp:Transcript_52169/g.124319  ORF Transcript_52169/g.124319 Transcript_52169/m.124319 type:complete len:551 (+) Transcript_52169:65-1717(+)